MARHIDHVLLTRFNLPTEGFEGLIRAREGWLRERVELFEAYCAPSVSSQACQNFRWIVYFDPDSPEWLKDWISKRSAGLFTPIFRLSVTSDDVVIDIKTLLGPSDSILVTSNIDNDDALALNFVERIQATAASYKERSAVYMTYGLIKNGSRIYLRRDARNAFCSVVETWDSPRTCWYDWHNLLGNSMSVLQAAGDPGWLQVVHGRNVSNRVRGKLVAPYEYLQLFPRLLDDVAPVPFRVRASDVMFAQPMRTLKEIARAALKAVAIRAFGKEGLNHVKTFWVSRNGRLNF